MTTRSSKRRGIGDDSTGTISINALLQDTDLHEVAQGGDLVLKAGEMSPGGYRLIKVHSFCLKLASPVFRAMLDSSFAEGTTAHTEEKPLPLPDENGLAFLELCNILHHKPSQPPNLFILQSLVVIADKYQCVDSDRAHVQAAIGPYFDSATAGGSIGPVSYPLGNVTALCMACTIGDAHLFGRISAVVIMGSSRIAIVKEGEALGGLLPPELTSKLLAVSKRGSECYS